MKSKAAHACYCCRDGGCQPGCKCQPFEAPTAVVEALEGAKTWEMVPWDEEAWHKEQGHKKRFRWRTRRTEYRNLPQRPPVGVSVVIRTPHYRSISVTVPSSWTEKWVLECGHIINAPRRLHGIGPFEPKYDDPEEYREYCGQCLQEDRLWVEERYKEWYWAERHDPRHIKCPDCGECQECVQGPGHKKDCPGPAKDWVMECLSDQIGMSKLRDHPRYDEVADEVWEALRGFLDMLDAQQLREAVGWYAE